MSAIIPFDFSAPAPAPKRRDRSLNAEVMIGGGGFPVISIKGKVFAVVKGDERQIVTRVVDGEVEPAPALNMVVVRANPKARVFYAKAYTEGDSDGAKPTCFSHDGVRPDASVEQPQSNNCQVCPHAQWASKVSTDGQPSKGTACTVNTRLAVIDPKAAEPTPYLLRVPAGSRMNFNDAVKLADQHGKDYNEVSMRIGFDQEAPSPKLTFRPSGLLAEDLYAKVQALYDDPVVKDIVGTPSLAQAQEVRQALPAPSRPQIEQAAAQVIQRAKAPPVTEDEVEAAISQPPPAPIPAPAKATRAKAKPAPQLDDTASGLLGELSSLLGSTDD